MVIDWRSGVPGVSFSLRMETAGEADLEPNCKCARRDLLAERRPIHSRQMGRRLSQKRCSAVGASPWLCWPGLANDQTGFWCGG